VVVMVCRWKLQMLMVRKKYDVVEDGRDVQ